MKNYFIYILLFALLPIMVNAKNWKFVKELDGVRIYSGQEDNQKYKSFRGIAVVNMSAEKVFAKLENVQKIDWWTKDIAYMKIFTYKKNKLAQFYLVYHLPWPLKNRDLYVNSESYIDYSTNEYRYVVVPLTGKYVTSNDDNVRINDFRQDWKVTAIDKNKSKIDFEYYIDIGVNLPKWLVNNVLSDSPAKIIKALVE